MFWILTEKQQNNESPEVRRKKIYASQYLRKNCKTRYVSQASAHYINLTKQNDRCRLRNHFDMVLRNV